MDTSTFLKRHLEATDEETPRLIEMANDSLSQGTDFPVGPGAEERLWRYLQYPYYLGLFARRVVTAPGISPHVKEKLCHAVLQINVHLDEGQEPGPGLFQLTAWLGIEKKLAREDYLGLRRGLIWLPRLTDSYIEGTEFIFPATEGVFRDVEVSREESIELILMMLTAKEAIGGDSMLSNQADSLARLDRLMQQLHRLVYVVAGLGILHFFWMRAGRLEQLAPPEEVYSRPTTPFVAEFVGGSRGLRRLSVTPIDPAHLETMEGVNASDLGGTIDVSATLEDAMALMMREDKSMVGVTDGARFLGVLTPNGVHAMLRADVNR